MKLRYTRLQVRSIFNSCNTRHRFTMTPAITALQRLKIPFKIHEYQHDPTSQSYGLEAAEKLALDPARVFKTLIAQLDDRELVVAILPVNASLNMKLLAQAAKAKKAAMAEKSLAEKSTGYVLGGISPFGQKKSLRTFLHESGLIASTLFVSAGRRGLEIELTASHLLAATRGTSCSLCREA